MCSTIADPLAHQFSAHRIPSFNCVKWILKRTLAHAPHACMVVQNAFGLWSRSSAVNCIVFVAFHVQAMLSSDEWKQVRIERGQRR